MNNKFKIAASATISSMVLAGALFASANTNNSCYNFTVNMRLGTTNPEVKMLQEYLNANGYTVSATGIGSAGNETNYFGAKTKAAVRKFQAANGIPSTGNVYSLTRAALNSKCAGSNTNTNTNTNTNININNNNNNNNNTSTSSASAVSVSLASSQPNNVLVSGSARANLVNFSVTGNGTVVSLKLARTGVSNNSTLGNIYLYDTATNVRLTDAATLLTDGTVTFNNVSGLFTAPKNISVVADIAENVTGQTVGISVVGITTQGGTMTSVSGVAGPLLPIANANVTLVHFNTSNTVGNQNINAGTMGKTVWGNTLTVSANGTNNSGVKFSGATFKFIGSA